MENETMENEALFLSALFDSSTIYRLASEFGELEIAEAYAPMEAAPQVAAPALPPITPVAPKPVPAPEPEKIYQIQVPAAATTAYKAIPCRGENGKNVLVACYELKSAYPDKASMEFLMRVLSAVNLEAKRDIALVNVAHPLTWQVLQDQFAPRVVLAFDTVRSAALPAQVGERYSPQVIAGITYLFADALPKIAASNDLKRALWSGLKQVFG